MKKLTSFDIKLIAFILMIVDHTARLFFDSNIFGIAAGRLSFPLFAWSAAVGQRHTSDVKKYIIRLILLGIVSQPIYSYIFYLIFDRIAPWNILFTLGLGVFIITILNKIDNIIVQIIALVPFLMLSDWINVEGGQYGLMTIYFMSKFEQKNWIWYFLFTLMNIAYVHILMYPVIEILGVFSVLILACHNGERGRQAKWFYLIYPGHLGILAVVKWFLN